MVFVNRFSSFESPRVQRNVVGVFGAPTGTAKKRLNRATQQMMNLNFSSALGTTFLLFCASCGLAKPTSTPVALEATAKNNSGRHVSMKAGGGLVLGSTVVSSKEIFTLVDLNGGTLRSGDAVQIQTIGPHPTFWQEFKNAVNRTGEHPTSACTFHVRWKLRNRSLRLQTASGKFVSGPGKGQDLVTTSKMSDPTTVFTLVKNPVASPKPTATTKRPNPSGKQ